MGKTLKDVRMSLCRGWKEAGGLKNDGRGSVWGKEWIRIARDVGRALKDVRMSLWRSWKESGGLKTDRRDRWKGREESRMARERFEMLG